MAARRPLGVVGSKEGAQRPSETNFPGLVCLNEFSGGEGGDGFLVCLVCHREEDITGVLVEDDEFYVGHLHFESQRKF